MVNPVINRFIWAIVEWPRMWYGFDQCIWLKHGVLNITLQVKCYNVLNFTLWLKCSTSKKPWRIKYHTTTKMLLRIKCHTTSKMLWCIKYQATSKMLTVSTWVILPIDILQTHYDDVIMTMLASQITSLTVVYSIVYSGVNQRKHQSPASLAFVREIHRGPVNFPHKWPVTRKMFPFDDVIMIFYRQSVVISWLPVQYLTWTRYCKLLGPMWSLHQKVYLYKNGKSQINPNMWSLHQKVYLYKNFKPQINPQHTKLLSASINLCCRWPVDNPWPSRITPSLWVEKVVH